MLLSEVGQVAVVQSRRIWNIIMLHPSIKVWVVPSHLLLGFTSTKVKVPTT